MVLAFAVTYKNTLFVRVLFQEISPEKIFNFLKEICVGVGVVVNVRDSLQFAGYCSKER